MADLSNAIVTVLCGEVRHHIRPEYSTGGTSLLGDHGWEFLQSEIAIATGIPSQFQEIYGSAMISSSSNIVAASAASPLVVNTASAERKQLYSAADLQAYVSDVRGGALKSSGPAASSPSSSLIIPLEVRVVTNQRSLVRATNLFKAEHQEKIRMESDDILSILATARTTGGSDEAQRQQSKANSITIEVSPRKTITGGDVSPSRRRVMETADFVDRVQDQQHQAAAVNTPRSSSAAAMQSYSVRRNLNLSAPQRSPSRTMSPTFH